MANVKRSEHYYELHESEYPRLGSTFFRQLRQEIPQAFRRSVKNNTENKHTFIQQQQHSGYPWETWIENIDVRLKQNCDNFHALRNKKLHLLSQLDQLHAYILQTVQSLDVSSGSIATLDGNITETVRGSDNAVVDWSINGGTLTTTATAADSEASVCHSGAVDIVSEVLSDVDDNFSDELHDELKCTDEGSEADYDVSTQQGMKADYDIAVQQEGIEASSIQCTDGTSVDSDKSFELLLWCSDGMPHESIERPHTLQSSDGTPVTPHESIERPHTLQSSDGMPLESIERPHTLQSTGETLSDGLICCDSVCKFDCYEHLTDRTSCKPPSDRRLQTRSDTSRSRSLHMTQLENKFKPIVIGQDHDIRFVAPSPNNNKSKFKFPWKRQKKLYKPADEIEQWHINFNNWKIQSASNHTLQRVFIGAQSDVETDATDTLSDDILDCSLNDCFETFSSSVTMTTALSKPEMTLTRRHSDDVSSSPPQSHHSLHQHVSNIKLNTAKHWQRLRQAVSLQRLSHTTDSPQHVDHTLDSPHSQSWNKLSERASVRSLSADRDLSRIETSCKLINTLTTADDVNSLSSWRSSTSIDSPRHFRPIGRVVSYNKDDGTKVIELSKPPHGPFGFYVDKCTHKNGAVVVSRLCDGLPEHFFAGLLNVGDEILQLNNRPVSELSAEAICDVIAQSTRLLLTIQH